MTFPTMLSTLLRRRAGRVGASCALVALCVAPAARAQDETDDGVSLSLGVDPSIPQVQALPGGTLPRLGEPPGEDFRFDFHGIITAPLRVGINDRDPDAPAGPGQSETVLHAPPIVPDDLETFSHTGVVPRTYAQLNLSYGNSLVVGTATIVAEESNVSSGFFDPPSQRGVQDLFLTLLPDLPFLGRTTIYVGAFSNRYGVPGEYDEGRYGTPLIARTNGAGENIVVNSIGLSEELSLMVEHGLQGQTSKAGNGVIPEGWNDFADPGVGSSFVHHAHLGLSYLNYASLGAHYMLAWAQDDRATGANAPDGDIQIIGADLRLNMARFGHLYTAYSNVKATSARTVGRIVEVLNTDGGPGLMANYLGLNSGGTGTLNILGWQYDLSVGRLISYPVPFGGDGPDIFVSLFGMYVGVESNDVNFDGSSKVKFGAEGTYSMLPWLAAGIRYDNVSPGRPVPLGDQPQTQTQAEGDFAFQVIAPRIMLRTGWQARDQVVIQYARWINQPLTTVRAGFPPVEDPSVRPDENVISISANMWW